jgi:iron complex outermembrane recepter protein
MVRLHKAPAAVVHGVVFFPRACVISLALATASFGMMRSAHAADAPSADADSTALVEVVVTAEKRKESALTTPIALAAYDSESLKENQIITVADLQNVDPSLNIAKGGFGDIITIRGVTSVDTTSKGTPGIAFNIDGIPVNRGYEQAEAFFDLDRVEVLKGPQGTLYGASSTGGALNIITAKPKDSFDAALDVTAGDYNTRRTTAMVNLPVTDMVSLRAAVNYNYHDGYNVLSDGTPYTNGENNVTSRFSGLLKFTDDITLLLQETVGSIGGPGAGSVNYGTVTGAATGSAQRVVYDSPFRQLLDDSFSNFEALFNWAAGPVHVAYVGGYFNFSANEYSASTNNPVANETAPFVGPVYAWRDYHGHFLTDSHELRFSNERPGAFDWVFGANWFRENIHESDHNWNAGFQTPNSDPNALPGIADSVNGIDPLNNTLHTAEGVFGQATWHVTSQIDLTAGLRDTRDTENRYGTFAFGGGPPWLSTSGVPCVAPADCVGTPNNGSESDSKVTYRGNITYHFTPTQMVYATVASGFKGGGFNDFCGTGPCPYGPEELVSYELGYKGRPLENLEFNSDLFYYDYSERQFSQLEIVGGSGVIFTQLAPAVIQGWENEITFRPTHADELHLSATLLHSYYTNLTTYSQFGPPAGIPGSIPVSLTGRSLDDTPKLAATLSYSHTFDLSNGGSLKAEADTKYSTAYDETNIGPFIPYSQSAFTRTNASIRYNVPGGKMYLGAFIRNIENKLQLTGAPATPNNPAAPNGFAVTVTDPRTFGVTAGLRF